MSPLLTKLRLLKLLIASIGLLVLLAACEKTSPEITSTDTASVALRFMVVGGNDGPTYEQYNGTVESQRQAELAAQVSGRVTRLNVTEGQLVKQRQILVHLDAQAAQQTTHASQASLNAAQAQQALALSEYQRKQQLFEKAYISKGALEQAEATYKSAQAQVRAQSAQSSIANVQTNFFLIKAPFEAMVSAVPVNEGDMAMPGMSLLTIYDPRQMRVSVSLPQSMTEMLDENAVDKVSVSIHGKQLKPVSMQWLPAYDSLTHSRELRINLPADVTGISPGMTVAVHIAMPNIKSNRLWIPSSALVEHSEMKGVYVISASGQPLLRQVRVGQTQGQQVEILSGLSVGERLALDQEIAAGV